MTWRSRDEDGYQCERRRRSDTEPYVLSGGWWAVGAQGSPNPGRSGTSEWADCVRTCQNDGNETRSAARRETVVAVLVWRRCKITPDAASLDKTLDVVRYECLNRF